MAVDFGFVLAAGHEVAFHHQAHDVVFTGAQLLRHILSHFHLAGVVFAAVGVAAIHHQFGCDAGFGELLSGGFYVAAVVVGLFAAAQNHVAVGIADGVHNSGMAGFGDR